MTVMQTGSIALVALLFGDYATQLLPLGAYSSGIYGAAAIVVLTALNVVGTWQGKTAQNLLTMSIVVAMVTAFVASVAHPGVAPAASTGTLSIGGAMILVLLTYGGWNEAAYLSGEIKDVRRNMVRALMVGIGVVTLLYVGINYAYVRVLGLDGLRSSEAIGADLMRATLGDAGAVILIVLVVAAALSTANATIFTGARTNFALGRDFSLFRVLGSWKRDGETPANGLLLQAAIALLLLAGASVTRSGIQAMVDYTAPVFWLFFLLTGIALFILRRRTPEAPQPFRVPLYPITPLLFCAICGYMLYSSVTFTGMGAVYGIAIVLAGLPVLGLATMKQK
jgi:amino acid transporter